MRWFATALILVFVGIFSLHFLAGPTSSDGDRLSTEEKRQYSRQGPRAVPLTIDASALPGVREVRVEKAEVRLAPDIAEATRAGRELPLKSWAMLEVVLHRPIEEPEVDDIGADLRRQAAKFDAVGVRFFLAATLAQKRDPATGRGQYAWRLYDDGADDIRNTTGLTPSALAAQADKLTVRSGERLEGIWVDHAVPNGALALSRGEDQNLYLRFLISPDRRFMLRREGDGLYEAEYVESPEGRFDADGSGTDRLGVTWAGDRLDVHAGAPASVPPWIVASRWR